MTSDSIMTTIPPSQQSFHFRPGGIVNANTHETVFYLIEDTSEHSLTHHHHAQVFRPGQTDAFATIKHHPLSADVEVDYNDHKVKMHPRGLNGFRYFLVPSTNTYSRWCWDDKHYTGLALLDETDNRKVIASFKGDLLQLREPVSAAALDDILVSGLAMWSRNQDVVTGRNFVEQVPVTLMALDFAH